MQLGAGREFAGKIIFYILPTVLFKMFELVGINYCKGSDIALTIIKMYTK